ncbi:hypothetical protein ABZ719_03605 [Streptomyces sp. NPDC006743]|uniref:hypothetical protein n=1 Tax=Streptomyces sp. NPDC006743 TaxID=3154480 RepID=UPI003454FDD5
MRPIRAFADDEGPTDDAVAAYVAKYVSKGTPRPAPDWTTASPARTTSARPWSRLTYGP